MKWPWQRAAEEANRAERARERLREVVRDWPEVYAAAGNMRVEAVRNNITQKAFALRDRSRG